MPELPEVETVKNTLLPKIKNKTITKVEVAHSGVLKNAEAGEFKEYLEGQIIEDMERRGKYMIFRLSHNKAMVLHLRMTGQCVYFEAEPPALDHCHVTIYLQHGGLYYRDVRRFGGFWIGDDIKALGSGIENLGPEPLGEDFNSDYLQGAVAKKNAPIKSILLDQSIVAGIGNIYADEIAFGAGVNPLKPGDKLSPQEIEDIIAATKEILTLSIANRGTTFSDYRDGYGDKGSFQNYLKIFQRSGEPCAKCGTVVQRTKCGGRGTSFCPKCQPYGGVGTVIGITGGIACGKTLATDFLKGLGAEIIDADIVAREVVEPGSKTLDKIAAAFGAEFIHEDGSLDRRLLREEVFKDPQRVKELNAITHPAIRRK
ncbi:MAG: bifunctional DNA-formamidopyrimidine glycosylase/DNA-(apurinic or apyrimidinic site) lyase, partial [Bacillota bacterium]|nr:bifunctional DNA-formamidopyrimidine glycosylase/DNA-(apurinic or apyrimidinic site) lyase [Bacillota bacterium]